MLDNVQIMEARKFWEKTKNEDINEQIQVFKYWSEKIMEYDGY
jgi:hypothetical protein